MNWSPSKKRAQVSVCVTGLRGMPAIMGGVETHCEELLPRVADADHDVHIEVCGRAYYMGGTARRVGRVKVTPLPSTIGKSSEAFTSTLVGILHARKMRAAVIHIHAVGPALLAPLARLLGMRVVFTHHGADYERAKWGPLARFALRLGERAGMSFAHRVICVSPSLRDAMVRRYPGAAKRTMFIPNGAATLPPHAQCDEHILFGFGLSTDAFILSVARLVPEKGLDVLIRAHAASGTNKPLVIAGAAMHGDSYAQELQRLASPHVRFLGALPRDVLGALYRNAALFVLPSFHEGLPIAALEALSSDCPMLLSDISANKDIGLPAEHYFPAGDVEGLTQKLIASADLRKDMRDVKKKFDWDRIAAKTLSVYRSVGDHRGDG